MKLELKKHKYYLLVLTAMFFVLIYLFVPEGSVFGSNTDWMSQHAELAETLRDACLSQGTIFPDFLWLGGGSNAYEFAYYGYLRPDIVIGCLLPQVPMIYILIFSMLVCVLASGLLCYCFLIQNRMEPFMAFIGSTFLMTAGCFFQAHRQVMFVNYMPYELLALLLLPKLVEKGKYTLFTVMLTLVIYNSFYYSITVLVLMTWRMYELTRDRKKWFVYLRSAAIAVGMAGVLLLPTALVLLEHRRQGAGTAIAELFRPDFSLKGLLYDPYGIGLTLFALYALLVGLAIRRLRKRSIVLLAAVLLPVVSYFLNGMLYARVKILMPLLPLVVLQATEVLQMIQRKKWKIRIWPELFFGGIAVVSAKLAGSEYYSGVLLDAVLLVMVLCLIPFYNRRRIYSLLLVAPFVCSVYTARQDDFVPEGKWVSPFTEEEAEAVAKDPWARMDGMEEPLISSNRLLYSGQKSSTMYSSISNEEYSNWFFDIMRMPVRINNRVAMLCEVNPFQEYLMGVKYLQTTEDKVPVGYEIRARKGNSVLVENENVLPIAYLSTKTMSEEQFSELEFPENVEALVHNTVVGDDAGKETDGSMGIPEGETCDSRKGGLEDSKMEEKTPLFSKIETAHDIEVQNQDGSVAVNAAESGKVTLTLDEPVRNRIVILEFCVASEDGKRVTIDVNGVRNRLSSDHASYPNQNSRFTYYLTVPEGESLEQLEIEVSKGKFELSDFKWYEYPVEALVKEDAVPVVFEETQDGALMNCSLEAEEDCYFVTSIPYQNGLEILVDGEEVPVEKVNTAFAGAKISRGTHQIELRFSAPGQKAGQAMTAAGLCLLILCPLWDGWRRKKRGTELS